MAKQEKSINLFLENGNFDGIVVVEDTSWGSGVMYSAPRESVNELLTYKECSFYGVYILLSSNRIYIGQASDLKTRIKQHSTGKDWWEKVILMTTKEDSFTHTDIDYLEANFIKLAMKYKRYECDNKKNEKAKVSQFEKVKLDKYIDEAIFLLENIVGLYAFSHNVKGGAAISGSVGNKKSKVSNDKIVEEHQDIRSKSEALSYLNQMGIVLKSNKCTYASMQPKKIFWANPKASFVDEDWDIILNDSEKLELIYVHIPAGTFSATSKKKDNNFVVRKDKAELLDINIYQSSLIDMYSQIDLNKYVVSRYPY